MEPANREETVSPHTVRQRILRPATAEEKDRHARIRQEIKEELPELRRWAREAAARHGGRVSVGTVFNEEEADVVRAIDLYAESHALNNRSAVVREALANLLQIDIRRQPSGHR